MSSSKISKDVFASFVVFFVALPLSLGIALASGAPIQTGLIAAAIGGIVVGFFGGAPLQVSGPAAGLTVMVFHYIQDFGLAQFGWITVIAGIIQYIAGTGGIASFALMISPALIQAMLAGIGALIILGQLQVAMGFKPMSSAWQNIHGIYERLPQANLWALAFAVSTILFIFLWDRYSKKIRLQLIPAPLVAIILFAGMAFFMGLSPEQMPFLQITESLWHKPLLFDNIPRDLRTIEHIVFSAFALAFVASAESLLCAVATDQMHKGPRADLNKELYAQGIGNALSGLLGGLPITGVIVRSTANVNAGAQTKLSSILHGVWILVFSTLLVSVLNRIPYAILAGILITVGLKLIKWKEFAKARSYDEQWVFLGTFFGVIGLSLLSGIGIGLVITVYQNLKRQTKPNINITAEGEGTFRVTLNGNLNVFSVPHTVKMLGSIPSGANVTLLVNPLHIDLAMLQSLRNWKFSYEATGGTVKKPNLDEIFRTVNLES